MLPAEGEKKYLELIRNKSAEERFKIALELNHLVRKIMEDGIRNQNPCISPQEFKKRVSLKDGKMTPEEVLKEVVKKLDELNIPYALTGSVASSYYGRPRSTHDFDVIIQVSVAPGIVKRFLSSFEKDFYVSEEGVIDALLHRTMFNIIHHETGFKVDLWILKDDEYDRVAFSRRQKVTLLGSEMFILSAEDMILGKLQWYKISESDRQLDDVKFIYEVQKNNLDIDYLKKWSVKLSIHDVLSTIIK